METKYIVSGMTCGHCTNHVTQEVSQIEGVEQVNVQLEGGVMTVQSAQRIPLDSVVEAVKEAGDYTVVEA